MRTHELAKTGKLERKEGKTARRREYKAAEPTSDGKEPARRPVLLSRQAAAIDREMGTGGSGVCIIRAAELGLAANECDRLMRSAAQHVKALMPAEMPEHFDLTNVEHAKALHDEGLREQHGLTLEHLRLNPNQSLFTVIPSLHGITGLGACWPEAPALYEAVRPAVARAFRAAFGEPGPLTSPHLSSVDIGIQVPVSQKSRVTKRRANATSRKEDGGGGTPTTKTKAKKQKIR